MRWTRDTENGGAIATVGGYTAKEEMWGHRARTAHIWHITDANGAIFARFRSGQITATLRLAHIVLRGERNSLTMETQGVPDDVASLADRLLEGYAALEPAPVPKITGPLRRVKL